MHGNKASALWALARGRNVCGCGTERRPWHKYILPNSHIFLCPTSMLKDQPLENTFNNVWCLLFSQDDACHCVETLSKETKWLRHWAGLAGRLIPTVQCGRWEMWHRTSCWGAWQKRGDCWATRGAQPCLGLPKSVMFLGGL